MLARVCPTFLNYASLLKQDASRVWEIYQELDPSISQGSTTATKNAENEKPFGTEKEKSSAYFAPSFFW